MSPRLGSSLVLIGLTVLILKPSHGQHVDMLDVPAPSSVVYPPHSFPIRFDHDVHSGSMICLDCHVDAETSTVSAEELLPGMSRCGECHSQASDTEDPDACAFCHPSYRPSWPDGSGLMAVRDPRFPLVGPEPVVRSRPNLVFSHALHVGADCGGCHTAQAEGGFELPTMAVCTTCHEERGVTVACSSCHPTNQEGRLITELPGDDVTPTAVLRPRDHNADWAVVHALAASSAAESCFVCHSERDCLACHDGQLTISSIHPPGYANQHAALARRDQAHCGACHTTSTFCIDCHADAGVTSDPDHRPPLGTQLHPPTWLQPGGGDHGREAQLNMQACSSCHAESDCADCHATINPHGSSFFSRCDALLNANPQVCLRCHTSTTDLQQRCQ